MVHTNNVCTFVCILYLVCIMSVYYSYVPLYSDMLQRFKCVSFIIRLQGTQKSMGKNRLWFILLILRPLKHNEIYMHHIGKLKQIFQECRESSIYKSFTGIHKNFHCIMIHGAKIVCDVWGYDTLNIMKL